MRSDQELLDALIEGAKNSRYGKDPQHPDGDLAIFFANVCNENPAAFLALFAGLIQADTQTEPSVEPQHAEKTTERLQ